MNSPGTLLEDLLRVGPSRHVLALTEGLSLPDAVCRVLLWGKVRPASPDPAVRARIRRNVERWTSDGEPVRVVNASGGYKGIRSRTAPHLNWSEVFHLSFTAGWLANIAELYPPGIELEYCGHSAIATVVDNYKRSDVALYGREFDELVTRFDERAPANMTLRSTQIEDYYEGEDLAAAAYPDQPAIPARQREALIARYLPHARHNFVFDGERDLTALSARERDDELAQAVLRAYRWNEFDRSRRAKWFEDRVVLSNTLGTDDVYVVRSIEGTDKSFWLTEGALDPQPAGPAPVILMPDDRRLGPARREPVTTSLSSLSCGLETIQVLEPA